ncbi:PspA/IM30 family protein [Niallia endozanthoxylica]|uniref:PspA/IM30 family protein n=1 Tax=Niallia endozanthoxylica TaxID=2036016 RepID=A0A5J5HNV7_9BACI|nr:PspA/IM30 family protein [Niallia endozanthoxylica]KAA9021673.1 PspA/IM30 family protein [Niallia endozanthoxylica]
MGIYKRIKDMAAADINDALDKWEDPVSMLKQYLRELQSEIDKAHNALAKQLYVENKYEKMIEETVQIIVKRNRQTELAIEKNEDDIAKLAIADRIKQEEKLLVYQQQHASIQSQTQMFCEQLEKLKEKYEELQNRKLVLISRANVAKISSEMGKTLMTNTPEKASRGFARMEDRILQYEARAQAYNHLANTSRLAPLNKLDTMFDIEVEKELERVKKQKADIMK